MLVREAMLLLVLGLSGVLVMLCCVSLLGLSVVFLGLLVVELSLVFFSYVCLVRVYYLTSPH